MTLLWLNTICFVCQRTTPLTDSQHHSPEEHQWKWYMSLLNNTAHVLLTEAQGPIFGYKNTDKVHWFNFILKWEHMENGALGNKAILLNRCSCQRKHLEGKQVWLMRWFTTVNLGHNSNTISISFWAISRRKKSNYITVTEREEGTHTLILYRIFCYYIFIIIKFLIIIIKIIIISYRNLLYVKIMPSKNSNNLIVFPIKCYYFTKKPLQHNDNTVSNLELIYHYNKSD